MLSTATSEYQITDFDHLFAHEIPRYDLRVRDLPQNEKPREKLQNLGPRNLTVSELLAIVLGVGSKKEEVLSMSSRILKEYGEKAIQNESNPKRLAEVLDIPFTKACRVIASFEIGRRFHAQHAGRPTYVRNAKQAHAYLKEMGQLKKEQFRALYLNTRYQVIRDEVISIGSLTANIVHPREVFQPALEHSAVAIIVAHNHPSGSLKPSTADREVTKQLKAAGQLLGIEILDHLIITERSFKIIKEVS